MSKNECSIKRVKTETVFEYDFQKEEKNLTVGLVENRHNSLEKICVFVKL